MLFSYYYAKIKVDSCDSLSLKNRLTSHNIIKLIKSVLNKHKNHCYYSIFLETTTFFDRIIMLIFRETKMATENFYAATKTINI